MDWRETGEDLRELIIAGVEIMVADRKKHIGRPRRTLTLLELESHGPVDDSFVAAAIDAEYHDDRGPLIRYLSERPLGRQEQFALAQILEKPERKTGRPRELETLAAEAVASFFYREWRNRNRRSGISDHGHRGEMKDYAASFAVELACTYPADGAPKEPEEHDVQAVRDMMDRPRHRRLTLDEALLEMVRRGNAKCRQNP